MDWSQLPTSGCLLVSWCFEPSQPRRITSAQKKKILQSISQLVTPQVILPKDSFSRTTTENLTTISVRKPRKTTTQVLKPISSPRALDTGTFIQQGDLFYSAGLHWNWCQPRLTTEKLGRGLEKNAGEWTGKIEISKKEKSLAVSVACMAIH